jgi:histidine ammonia-lyase
MAAVRITEAPRTIEDPLAVPTARAELAEEMPAKIADGRAVMDRAPAAGNAVYGRTAEVGHAKDTRPGTRSLRLAQSPV